MVDSNEEFGKTLSKNTLEVKRRETAILIQGWKEKRTNQTINDLSFQAETERFELSIQLPVYTLSRRAPSATRTRLQFFLISIITSACAEYCMSVLSGCNQQTNKLPILTGRQMYILKSLHGRLFEYIFRIRRCDQGDFRSRNIFYCSHFINNIF